MPLPSPASPPAPLSLDPGELSISNLTRAMYVGVPISIDANGYILVSALVETTQQIDAKADAAATTAALALKAPLASPVFTGVPAAPTAAPGTNTTQLATTAFVEAALAAQGGVDPGIIAMWSGTIITIPAGWQLCNGTNGTPDLRNMFVVGAGGTYSPGVTGGAASAPGVVTSTDGSHSHTGVTGNYALTIADIPAHNHGTSGGSVGNRPNVVATSGGANVGHTHNMNFATIALPVGAPSGSFVLFGAGANTFVTSENHSTNHTHDITSVLQSIGGGGAHQHTISSDGGHSHTVTIPTLPPFYALAFIMKLP